MHLMSRATSPYTSTPPSDHRGVLVLAACIYWQALQAMGRAFLLCLFLYSSSYACSCILYPNSILAGAAGHGLLLPLLAAAVLRRRQGALTPPHRIPPPPAPAAARWAHRSGQDRGARGEKDGDGEDVEKNQCSLSLSSRPLRVEKNQCGALEDRRGGERRGEKGRGEEGRGEEKKEGEKKRRGEERRKRKGRRRRE
jgi:hypothetical protein